MSHTVAVAERVVWSGVVAVALVALAVGLCLTFHLEPTAGALAAAARGTRIVYDCSSVLGAAVLVGWLRGAPLWMPAAVLPVPVLCAGLVWAYPDTLLPYLAFVVTVPAAAVAALCALAISWRQPATAR